MELSETLNPLCVIDNDLTEKFVLLEHAVFVVSVPLNCIALWCIYTDRSTRIKWYLLNCQLWYIFNDACFVILCTPGTLFPFAAVYSYGVLNYIGVPIKLQICILFASLAGMITSVLHLFFYRHQTLIPIEHKRHIKRIHKIIFITFVYVNYGIVMPSVLYFSLEVDKLDSLRSYAPDYPCLYQRLFEDGIAVINRKVFNFIISYGCFYLLSWIAIIAFLAADSFQALRISEGSMSRPTRDHIRRSLIVVIVQLLIIVSFLAIPFIIFIYEIMLKRYDQAAVLVSIGFVSLHASAGTFASICLNKKYRENLSKKLSLYITPSKYQRLKAFRGSVKVRLAWATTASRSIGPVQNLKPNER